MPENRFTTSRSDELLTSVSDFLRQQVMTETSGRTQFLARVASNSLDIVQRELALGHLQMQFVHLAIRAPRIVRRGAERPIRYGRSG